MAFVDANCDGVDGGAADVAPPTPSSTTSTTTRPFALDTLTTALVACACLARLVAR
jgi:hypothetical protein